MIEGSEIKELIESELNEFSSYNKVNVSYCEDTETYKAEIYQYNELYCTLSFRYWIKDTYHNFQDKQLQVDLYEDMWTDIDQYSYSIKYFWIALQNNRSK